MNTLKALSLPYFYWWSRCKAGDNIEMPRGVFMVHFFMELWCGFHPQYFGQVRSQQSDLIVWPKWPHLASKKSLVWFNCSKNAVRHWIYLKLQLQEVSSTCCTVFWFEAAFFYRLWAAELSPDVQTKAKDKAAMKLDVFWIFEGKKAKI